MKTQLIVFEGLSPFLLPSIFGIGATYIKTGLLNKLDDEKFDLHYTSWCGASPKNIPVRSKVIVVAHSMGVATAIDWMKDFSKDVALFLALDGRPLKRPYVKPENVKRAYSWNRESAWMRGYPVEGAINSIVNCGHGAVPGLAKVKAVIEEEL